jgi:hypothetical protein
LGQVDDNQNLYAAESAYTEIKMGEFESIDKYCRRFEAVYASRVESAQRAEKEASLPSEDMRAIHFINNLNDGYG